MGLTEACRIWRIRTGIQTDHEPKIARQRAADKGAVRLQ